MATTKAREEVKKASKKQERAPTPRISPELKKAAKDVKALKHGTGHFTVAAAEAVPCLPLQTATGIVFSCLGRSAALDQTLGQLFPNDNARGAFCRCVSTSARQAGLANPVVPSSKTTTVGAVIQAIAC